MEEPDFIFTSKTQTPEALAAVLGGEFSNVEVTDTRTDQPAEAKPADSPVPEGDVSPIAEPEAPAPVADPEPPAPPAKKSGSARAREKLEKTQEELERIRTEKQASDAELERLRRELAERSAGKPAEPPPAPKPVPAQAAPPVAPNVPTAAEDPEPAEDTFEDHREYIKALTRWTRRDELRQEYQRQQETHAQAEQTRLADAATAERTRAEQEQQDHQTRWQSQCDHARQAHPDFDSVMNKVRDVQLPLPLVGAVLDRDDSAELAYWLTSHPEEEQRIAGLCKLGENPTPRQIRLARDIANRELDKIDTGTAAAHPEPARESRPAAAPPAPSQPPVAVPAAAQPGAPVAGAPPITPKPTPPSTVGGRGTPNQRSVQQLSHAPRGSAEERAAKEMDLDDYRKQRGM